jgi:hypothetical protein
MEKKWRTPKIRIKLKLLWRKMMKESTKTIIRTAAFILCLVPYQVKKEGDRRTYRSLLFESTYDQQQTPALNIRRNQSVM